MLGAAVSGSRTWMCTTAAPAAAASSADSAIASGLTGTAGFFRGVSKEPVRAQVMTVVLAMCVLPARQIAPPSTVIVSPVM
ncbi:hypothetical protein ME121_6317 [Methylobacterium sp. ME121]|jgi:hypothetical protein|nr:hypothetical protein ME121_6317 [Methylobacterium sp. ME121]